MTDVVIVGGGPAGRAVAECLPGRSVVVVDRAAGAQVVSVLSGTGGALHVNTIGVDGPQTIVARAVVLATGSRERTQGARLIAGTRVTGVHTVSEVRADPGVVGRSAIVLGGDRHGFEGVTLTRRAGARVKAVVTPWHRHQVSAWTFWLARLRNALVLKTNAYITAVYGTEHITGVQIVYRDGHTEDVACDTLVLAGDFVPEYEVALRSGLLIDSVTKGPAVDATGRTSRPGVFAVGSVVQPGWDGAVLNAQATADGVQHYLDSAQWVRAREITVAAPLDWVAPAFVAGPAPQTRFVLNAKVFRDDAAVVVRQDARELGRYESGPVQADAPFTIPGDWTRDLDPQGGSVTVDLVTP